MKLEKLSQYYSKMTRVYESFLIAWIYFHIVPGDNIENILQN